MYDIAIIGGDIRQIYMANAFLNHGLSVITYGLHHPLLSEKCKKGQTLKDTVSICNVLVSAIPFTKEETIIPSLTSASDLTTAHFLASLTPQHTLFAGVIPESISEHCSQNHISIYDFMKEDSIAIKNAIATAEGTIMEAIQKSAGNLHKSRCLILGYGRCAQILAHKLHALSAHVTIAARRDSQLAYADAFGYDTIYLNQLHTKISSFDFIFNTIPACVLTRPLLECIPKHTVIIDISSSPGGIDYKAAEDLQLTPSLSLGIPGKVAPKASADILVEYILRNTTFRNLERRYGNDLKK